MRFINKPIRCTLQLFKTHFSADMPISFFYGICHIIILEQQLTYKLVKKIRNLINGFFLLLLIYKHLQMVISVFFFELGYFLNNKK